MARRLEAKEKTTGNMSLADSNHNHLTDSNSLTEINRRMKSIIRNFDVKHDKKIIARINETLAGIQHARDERVRKAEDELNQLSRQLGTLRTEQEDLIAAHNEADHASHIASLDTLKFRTAKAASDAEAETERLAGQAADLTARLQELESQGVEGELYSGRGGARGSDAVDDEVLLRLKLYRSLGIEIQRDQEEGEWTRAVVRNDVKGDVHVVNMDKKFSRFFYANYFWKMV